MVQIILFLGSLPYICCKTCIYTPATDFSTPSLYFVKFFWSSALLTCHLTTCKSLKPTYSTPSERSVFPRCIQNPHFLTGCRNARAGGKAHMPCLFKTTLLCRTSKTWPQQFDLTQLLENSAQKQLHLSLLLCMEPKKIKSCLCNVPLILLTYNILKTKHNTFELRTVFQIVLSVLLFSGA